MTDSRMGVDQRQNFNWILEEAGIEPADLSVTGREVVAVLANAGQFICEGVRNLVAAALRSGFAEGDEAADRYEDGVPFFRHDATVTVTITASELAERGMPDNAVIGVAWGDDGDECIRYALAGAGERAASDPDDRGSVSFTIEVSF